MHWPTSTGCVASRLAVSEPRLNDLVRRGKITPAPLVVAGRRLWNPEHVLQAAKYLGALDDDLRAELEENAAS